MFNFLLTILNLMLLYFKFISDALDTFFYVFSVIDNVRPV